jgi:hypothetical protein
MVQPGAYSTKIKTGIYGQPDTKMHLGGRRGESNFRIKIFTNIRGGQKDEFGKLLSELALLTASYIREYFYTKIRFYTPAP